MQGKKIGISLSGGGARGWAHIGVLKALEEHAIFPDFVAGCSAGSIIGTLYAAGKPPDEILEIVKSNNLLRIIQFGMPIAGLTNLNYLREQLEEHLEQDSFESLRKRLFIAVTNLNTGKLEIKSSGELFKPVMASCSIPTIFKPVAINGSLYVDGGVMNNMPVDSLRAISDVLIGVNVMPHGIVKSEDVSNIAEIAVRCLELVVWNNAKASAKKCDVLIEVEKASLFQMYDFNYAEKFFEFGYEAAMQKIPDLLRKLL